MRKDNFDTNNALIQIRALKEDKRTVYGECTYRLVLREDEPSVCLMHNWIYLPSA